MSDARLNLIVRLPNWVGDVIMALPALQAMQQSGLQLTLFGKPWICDLLTAMEMPLQPLAKTFWQTRHALAAMTDSDKVLLLTNSLSSAFMARLAGKAAIGYKKDGRQLLLKAYLTKPSALHEVEYFWEIAHFATQYWFKELTWPKEIPARITLPLSTSAINKAHHLLKEADITKPFIVLCPFAHGTGKDGKLKIWPYWRELATALSSQPLIVCPGKNEEALCAELAPNVIVLSDLNLGEYAAVLSKASKVIANDSGPMHLAAAVGADTLGIFGVSDPKRTAPWGADSIGNINGWPTLTDVLKRLNA